MHRFIRSLLITAIATLSTITFAQSYKGYTLDPETNIISGHGLDWLRWTETKGQSVNEALENYPGWRLASNAEMADLFNEFRGRFRFQNLEDYRNFLPLAFGPGENTYSRIFVELFGATSSTTGGDMDPYDYAMYAKAKFGNDADNDGFIRYATMSDDYSTNDQEYDGYASFSRDLINKNNSPGWSDAGIALVRESQPGSHLIKIGKPLKIYPSHRIFGTGRSENSLNGGAIDVYKGKYFDSTFAPLSIRPVTYSIKNRNGGWVTKHYFGQDDFVAGTPITAIASSGLYSVMGAPAAYNDAGEAYIFSRDSDGSWSNQLTINASGNGSSAPQLGYSVDISGERIVVSAPSDNSYGYENSGSVYFYTKIGDSWSLVSHVDQDAESSANNRFGWATAISNRDALITAVGGVSGNSGSAYFYHENNRGIWMKKQLVTPENYAAEDGFGQAVAMDGRYAFVSAPFKSLNGAPNSGNVHVYRKTNNGSWVEQQILSHPESVASSHFGETLAVDDDTLLVGSPFSGPDGAVYVYKRNSNGWWAHAATLGLIDHSYFNGDAQGIGGAVNYQNVVATKTIAVHGDDAIVSAPLHDYVYPMSSRIIPRVGRMWSYDLSVIE